MFLVERAAKSKILDINKFMVCYHSISTMFGLYLHKYKKICALLLVSEGKLIPCWLTYKVLPAISKIYEWHLFIILVLLQVVFA